MWKLVVVVVVYTRSMTKNRVSLKFFYNLIGSHQPKEMKNNNYIYIYIYWSGSHNIMSELERPVLTKVRTAQHWSEPNGLESLLSIVSCVNRDFTELSNRVGFKPMESWFRCLCWQIVPSSRYLGSPCVNRDRWVKGHFFGAKNFPLRNKEKGATTLLYVGFFGAKMSPYF